MRSPDLRAWEPKQWKVRLDQERPGHWSTDGVDQRRALAYWVDTVCDRFLELEIDTHAGAQQLPGLPGSV